ncbi:MAG: hypothetical protein IRZ16_13180 [Myxococcaceae bacterium]|nr:hypothetical protein [Myxococcaceae bacterium]
MRLVVIVAASLFVSSAAFAQAEGDFSPPPLPGEGFTPEPWAPTLPAGPDAGSAGGVEVAADVPAPASGTRLTRVTAGVLSPLTGTLSAEVERAVTDRVSIFAGPRLALVNITSIGLSAGARYFPMSKDTAPAGLWVGPELWLEYGNQSGNWGGVSFANQENTAFLLAMAGYTTVDAKGFTMSFGGGFGGGYYAREGTGVQTLSFSPTGLSAPAATVGDVSEVSFKPTFGAQFNIGYAF